MTTRAAAIADAVARLNAAGVDTPERDATLLCRWASGLSGAGLHARLNDIAPVEELSAFADAISQRAGRRPVAQITGMREFWSRPFIVTGDVLDPRPDSEALIEAALTAPADRILDLGTGSGCLLLTLLAEMPRATGLGVDLSPAALEVARRNASALGVDRRLQLICSDWFAAVSGRFDLIVANPPYLTEAELDCAQPELAFEPAMALSPGADGLDAYRRIVAGVADHLAPAGRVLFEIGANQASSVTRMMRDAGLCDIRVLKDLNGYDRVVAARVATVC